MGLGDRVPVGFQISAICLLFLFSLVTYCEAQDGLELKANLPTQLSELPASCVSPPWGLSTRLGMALN